MTEKPPPATGRRARSVPTDLRLTVQCVASTSDLVGTPGPGAGAVSEMSPSSALLLRSLDPIPPGRALRLALRILLRPLSRGRREGERDYPADSSLTVGGRIKPGLARFRRRTQPRVKSGVGLLLRQLAPLLPSLHTVCATRRASPCRRELVSDRRPGAASIHRYREKLWCIDSVNHNDTLDDGGFDGQQNFVGGRLDRGRSAAGAQHGSLFDRDIAVVARAVGRDLGSSDFIG
jgi:hypothetical protein